MKVLYKMSNLVRMISLLWSLDCQQDLVSFMEYDGLEAVLGGDLISTLVRVSLLWSLVLSYVHCGVFSLVGFSLWWLMRVRLTFVVLVYYSVWSICVVKLCCSLVFNRQVFPDFLVIAFSLWIVWLSTEFFVDCSGVNPCSHGFP